MMFSHFMAAVRRRWALLLGCVLVILGVAALLAVGDTGSTITTFSMGSYVQQTLYGTNKTENARVAANAVAELEDLISWRKDGDIAALNANAGVDFYALDERTVNVLTTALDVCEQSGGALDITIAPVSRLWDFDENPHVPDSGQIARFLEYIDYTDLSLLGDGTAALRSYNTAIDLGAVGKGAACDAAVAAYQSCGVSRAVVAVGGSIGLYGEKPLHTPWNIAVRDPNSEGSLGTLALSAGFLSTSGDYEKTFTEDGVTYHHILDPSTGYPAESGLSSVTVFSSGGALSDALSTACFILGAEDSLALLSHYDAEALFVTKEREILLTQGLKDAFTLSAEGYTVSVLSQ